MGGWGISKHASEKEKLKSELADYLHGLNATGEIDYSIYSEMFGLTMALMDQMYEQGQLDIQ